MQARTSPILPNANKKTHEVTSVWQQGQIQQPTRTPWGKVSMLGFLMSLVVTAGVLTGTGWYIHRYPNSWLARYAIVSTTTTVVQPTKDAQVKGIPENVQRLLATVYGINQNLGEDGVYRNTDASGYAWPLSGSGWLLSLSGAWPVDVKTLVAVPPVGSAQAITSTLVDPATPFVFLKTTDLTAQPISFAPAASRVIGSQVWVVTNQAAFPRQLGSLIEPRWTASDRRESYVMLDAPITAPVGSAVVDDQGRFIGLLGSDNHVWLIDSIEPLVSNVVQSATVYRTGIGVRTINLTNATVMGEPKAAGLLIGAGDGQVAVTPKSPADKAGLKNGDIIMSVNGAANLDDLFLLSNTYKSGDELKIIYRRGEQEKTTILTVGTIGS